MMTRMCDYCGEEPATDRIGNPNLDMGEEIDWTDEANWWQVCADCKQAIPLQMLSGCSDPKLQEYVSDKLDAIAKKSGKPIMSAAVIKKDDGSVETVEITYTGEKDD